MLPTALDQKADSAAIEQALFQAARSNPQNAQAHTDLGLFYVSKMQLEKAMDCFGQALQLDPNLRDAVWGRGFTCRLNGHGQSAIYLCKEFLKKNPNDTEIKQVLEAILSENPQASLAPDPEFNSRQSIINYLIDRFGFRLGNIDPEISHRLRHGNYRPQSRRSGAGRPVVLVEDR